jgi:hypothetical protein
MSATTDFFNTASTSASRADTRHIRDRASGQWPFILSALGIEVGKGEHRPCPACSGKDRFKFDDEDGRGTWFCNQCDPHAGDGFSLVQNVKKCKFPDAIELVARMINHNSESGRSGQQGNATNGYRTRTSPPEGKVGIDLFVYHSAKRESVIFVRRIDSTNGTKQFHQWGPTADGVSWQSNLSCAPKPRPLYRLCEILADPNDFILFHEGEKACEAAVQAALSGIHTTTLGGANNPSQTDFSPVNDRDVVICPDNDKPGEKYAKAVARLAHDAGAKSVKVLKLPGLPLKGDMVEWLAGGGTAQTFRSLLEHAITCPANEDKEEKQGSSSDPPLILSRALISLTELRTKNLPERKRHLAWLLEGSLVMMFGARGVGKTWLQLGLAASLTTGTPFLKWPVTAPTGVLYVDGEMPLDELKARSFRLMPTESVELVFLTSETVYQSLNRDLVLTSEAMRAQLDRLLDERPEIRVIILDNISSLFTGLNEDKKQDWEPINAWLLRLMHRGLAIILIHHAGKGGQQRGTSGREDAMDTVIQLSLPGNYEPKEGCHVELRFTKSRSVKGADVVPLDVKLEEAGGQLRWIYKPFEESKLDQVKRLVLEGVTSPSQIAEELGIHKSYASKLARRVKSEP